MADNTYYQYNTNRYLIVLWYNLINIKCNKYNWTTLGRHNCVDLQSICSWSPKASSEQTRDRTIDVDSWGGLSPAMDVT